METKHTPGPLDISNNGKIPIRIMSVEHSEWIDKETTVALVGGGRGAPGEFETNLANARLFAAAPDMYEAAKAIDDLFQRVLDKKSGAGQYYADGKSTLCAVSVDIELLTSLRTAIAKAEGKTQ